MRRLVLCLACAVLVSCTVTPGFGQRGGASEGSPTWGNMVYTGGGPGTIENQVAAIDFAQIQLQQQGRAHEKLEQDRARQKELVDSGMVSSLDLGASNKAIDEYNQGVNLLRSQHSSEAVPHLQKSVAIYPKFVSAYNALGLAYLDLDDKVQAKAAFQNAAGLDANFPGSVFNLGRLALDEGDYPSAQASLEKADASKPGNPEILTALAYAQYGNHQYRDAISTVVRVHQASHPGMGNAHYIAAASGLALQDGVVVDRELTLFLAEDPTNPLAPVARQNLDILTHNKAVAAGAKSAGARPVEGAAQGTQTDAERTRLQTQLNAVGPEGSTADCDACETKARPANPGVQPADTLALNLPVNITRDADNSWTIRKAVDEVAVFFAVSSHGHMVNDLQIGDIEVQDDGKSPERILQFTPQSMLPLRVALLVDTSGSVRERFSFEKYGAGKFLQQLLTNPSDLAFVEGFSNTAKVTQDFTANHDELVGGIEKLANGGGTSLFDAVSFACGKLAAYPETERVAKVLVVLSDGEDNSSHTTLKRAIADAESSGVTIYAISTRDTGGPKSEADHVLEALANHTGGEALFPEDNNTLRRSFDKLRDMIRSRYLIAYKPAGFEANGKYRAITIVATRNGKHLQVHARKGYHARLTPAGS